MLKEYEVLIIRHYEELKAFFSAQKVVGDESDEDDSNSINGEFKDGNEDSAEQYNTVSVVVPAASTSEL